MWDSLLDAADSLLAARAGQPLTLRDVAKAAGVSHAAPYHHFASLADLLAALAERGFANLAAAMEGASRAESPRDAMVDMCETYVEFARARPGQFRLMFGPLLAHKADFPELAQAAEEAFGGLLAGAMRYSPANGAALALAGWSLAHGLANLLIDGAFTSLPIPTPPAEVLARMMALHVLEGTSSR